MSYVVKSGDTLSKIAAANNTTVAVLMTINPDIKDANRIRVGQNLRVVPNAEEKQAMDLLKDGAVQAVEIIIDKIVDGLYSVAKCACTFGGAAGAFEHASKNRFAAALAKKEGISQDAAFMKLDQMGLFDDRFY